MNMAAAERVLRVESVSEDGVGAEEWLVPVGDRASAASGVPGSLHGTRNLRSGVATRPRATPTSTRIDPAGNLFVVYPGPAGGRPHPEIDLG